MQLVVMVEAEGGLDGIKILSDENTGVVFCLGLGYFFSGLGTNTPDSLGQGLQL